MLIYGISKVYVEKSTGRRISGHRAALTNSFQFWHLEFPMTLGILYCHWQNHFFFFLSTQSIYLITCRNSKEVDAKTLQLLLSILSASSKIVGLRSVCYCSVTSVVSDSVRPHREQPTRLPHPWDSPGKNTGVSCHFLLQCMKVKSESEVDQSCPTLSDPMDCSLPGSSVRGIFQARATGVGYHCLVLSNLCFWNCDLQEVQMVCIDWSIPLHVIFFQHRYIFFF